jgi:hypothetical protein
MDTPGTSRGLTDGHQRILVVEIDGYACVVPYVQEGNKRFLKTI